MNDRALRSALIVIHKSLRASGASTISVVGADRAAFRLSAKAGTSDKDPASESQYSRTSPLPLSGTAFLQVDLCITMSAPRGNASQDAPRPGDASGVTRDHASQTSLPLNRNLHLITIQPRRPDLQPLLWILQTGAVMQAKVLFVQR